MIKHLILCLILTLSCSVMADFVDIATIKINGTLIRRVTNNSINPYLINLSKCHIGDTLNIQIWTDHGAERNSFVSIRNLETNRKYVLDEKNSFIITAELLQKNHLISVSYITTYPEETEIVWDICKIIPNNQIELVYASIGELKEFMLVISSGKPKFSSPFLNDSIITNYKLSFSKKGVMNKILQDTINYPITKIRDFLTLNETEKSFIKKINSIDYVKLHDFTSDMYGSIRMGETIDTFCFTFGDFTYQLEFYFIYYDNKYQLEKIIYHPY